MPAGAMLAEAHVDAKGKVAIDSDSGTEASRSAPGPDDEGKRDVVMMDDFIYGEPQPLP